MIYTLGLTNNYRRYQAESLAQKKICQECDGKGETSDADFSDGDSDKMMFLHQDTVRECSSCRGLGYTNTFSKAQGGTVWRTLEEAQAWADGIGDMFSVWSVDADWNRDCTSKLIPLPPGTRELRWARPIIDEIPPKSKDQ